MVERQLPKLHTTVRSRSPAPVFAALAAYFPHDCYLFDLDIWIGSRHDAPYEVTSFMRHVRFFMSIDQFSGAVVQWARKFPVINRVWLYGSRVKGNNRPDSDLDIAVELDPVVLRGVTPLAYWLLESQEMKAVFRLLVEVSPHIQLYHPTEREVFSAVEEHGVLVYAKNTKVSK